MSNQGKNGTGNVMQIEEAQIIAELWIYQFMKDKAQEAKVRVTKGKNNGNYCSWTDLC